MDCPANVEVGVAEVAPAVEKKELLGFVVVDSLCELIHVHCSDS